MAGSMLEMRGEEVISASISQVSGGALTVGPFAHDAMVLEFGAVVTTALTTGNVAVTTSPDVGSATLLTGTAANKAFRKDAKKVPSPADGTAANFFTLTKGNTLTVTGAAVGGSSGAYRLFASVIKLPLLIDGTNVLAG